jgi:hypothetical protein
MTKIIEINLDLDGVMFDFVYGVQTLTGGWPHEIPKRDMWKAIAKHKTFFEDLLLLPDALELFSYVNAIPNIKKRILTGLPTINDGANQKRRSVARHLCDKIEVIVLPSKDKKIHSGPGKVLIDDRQDMIGPWCEAGGIGILHTSAETSIAALKALGL